MVERKLGKFEVVGPIPSLGSRDRKVREGRPQNLIKDRFRASPDRMYSGSWSWVRPSSKSANVLITTGLPRSELCSATVAIPAAGSEKLNIIYNAKIKIF